MFHIIRKHLWMNLKNLPGWCTKRKIVVFSVDDYGNVRINSKQARESLTKAGIKAANRFDQYDALENNEDLEALFEVLSTTQDIHGNSACFTPISLSANIDFESILNEGLTEYTYELLPVTFSKLNGYDNTYNLIKEGIEKRIFVPQYHGREHLNLRVFNDKLLNRDKDLLTVLKNRSYTGICTSDYPNIKYPSAFSFEKPEEIEELKKVAADGLNCFEKVYGYRAVHFNAPTGNESRLLHPILNEGGIKYIDKKYFNREHTGNGKFQMDFFYTGKTNDLSQTFIVKNCVFEPNENRGLDWVEYTIRQLETAFKWKKPAIISSHRVNFCGQIDPNYRKEGLKALKKLLTKIVIKWPDVEFLLLHDLAKEIESTQKDVYPK